MVPYPSTRRSTPIGAFDAIYALAFYFILWRYAWQTLQAAQGMSATEKFCVVFAMVVLSIQLLKMYVVLHTFDTALGDASDSHFLGVLSPAITLAERVLRGLMAVLLVCFTKLPEWAAALHITLPSSAHHGGATATTLFLCFIMLLVWDSFVWHGVRSAQTVGDDAWKAFRTFYYLPADAQREGIGRYPAIKRLKLWERGAVLIAGAVGTWCLFRPNLVLAILLVAVFLVSCIIMVLGLIAVDERSRDVVANLKSSVNRIVQLPVAPTQATYDYLRGVSSMNSQPSSHSRARCSWAASFILLGLAGLSVFAPSCSRPSETGSTPAPTSAAAPPPARVRIATSKNLWCALTLIAEHEQYFQDERLEPVVTYQAAGRLNMDALLGGAADVANVVETNLAYQAMNLTDDLYVLGRVVSATDYAILTKRSTGIVSPADLVGKHVAYAQATGAESYLFWFLEAHQLTSSTVTLVPLQPAGLVDHFVGERTEAVVAWEPFVSTIRSRVGDAVGTSFQAEPTGFAGKMYIATSRTYAEAHAPVLAAYERAMRKASDLARTNPVKAQQIVATQAAIPLETVRSIWSHFDYTYGTSQPSDAQLVEHVVRRIRLNVPQMGDKPVADPQRYFRAGN